MTEKMIIPQDVDAFVQFHVMAESEDDAEDYFVIAKERLLGATNWNAIIHADAPQIVLVNHKGEPVKRNAHQGDHLKLITDTKEQWFKITSIAYDDYPDYNAESMTISIAEVNGPLKNGEEIPEPQYFLITGRRQLKLTAHYYHDTFKNNSQELDSFPWLQWAQAILDFSEND